MMLVPACCWLALIHGTRGIRKNGPGQVSACKWFSDEHMMPDRVRAAASKPLSGRVKSQRCETRSGGFDFEGPRAARRVHEARVVILARSA